jgi:PKD repeat protein
MRKLILLMTAFVGILTINSCSKEEKKVKPVATADFSYTGGGCIAPCAVLFENKSKDATTYSWDFGDGTTSKDANPTKTYDVGGTYTVKLTATGEGGSGQSSKQILIQKSTQSQLPTANFNFAGNGVAPSTVVFTNSSTNATSYSWDFGDGGTSVSVNPTHTYLTGGTFSVVLTAINAAGTNKITKTVNITAPYTKVKITKVTIINIPFVTGSGSGWDPSDGPDVFFKVTDINNTIVYEIPATERISDIAPSDLPIEWQLATTYEITNFNESRFVDIWDYDTFDPNDLIGYVGFKMSDYTSGTNPYPTSVTNTENGITVKLDLVWQ